MNRTFMFMGTLPLGLSAQLYAVAEPSASLSFDMPAGLPVNIRINQTPLSTDGMMVTLDLTKPVVIEALTDKPNATLYLATVYEVALSADMMMVERRIVVE